MNEQHKIKIEQTPGPDIRIGHDFYMLFDVTMTVAVKNPRLDYDEGVYVEHEGVFLANTLNLEEEFPGKGYKPFKFGDDLDAFSDDLYEEVKGYLTA